MSIVAIYVFIFMLVASLLGFFAALAWKNVSFREIKNSLDNAQRQSAQLQIQLDKLQDHANQLENDKQKLVYENERLSLKLSMLLGNSNELENQKSIIENDGFVDTSHLDKKINDLNAQVDKLNSEIDVVKRESLEWQVQYTEVLKEKEELTLRLLALRNSSK